MNPKYLIEAIGIEIKITAENQEAKDFRNKWVEELEQEDTDILFFMFLVAAPSTSDSLIVGKLTSKFYTEIEIAEFDTLREIVARR